MQINYIIFYQYIDKKWLEINFLYQQTPIKNIFTIKKSATIKNKIIHINNNILLVKK
jgi:hypothetical protein